MHLVAWDEMKCGDTVVLRRWSNEERKGRKAGLGKSVCRVLKEEDEKESE